MRAATHLHREQQLLALSPGKPGTRAVMASDLPSFFRRGDLVVVNDAATLPASLPGTADTGETFELRLVQRRGPSHWLCLLLGDGSWRDDTNERGSPPRLSVGQRLVLGERLAARVYSLAPHSDRLVSVKFELDEQHLLSALYRDGRPIQYSYHDRALPLSWLQSPYAGRPWAIEMPSAGRAITWKTMSQLRRQGVGLARLTHSAGLSATGLPALDALLPLQEHYDIPPETVEAIQHTQQRRGRVIAVGTTVVRALEGCVAERGGLWAGEGDTRLVIDEQHRLRVVDGVLAGLHAPDESHFKLLSAFATPEHLSRAWNCALHLGYQNHELGDAMLVA